MQLACAGAALAGSADVTIPANAQGPIAVDVPVDRDAKQVGVQMYVKGYLLSFTVVNVMHTFISSR